MMYKLQVEPHEEYEALQGCNSNFGACRRLTVVWLQESLHNRIRVEDSKEN
jgi:hypothetical protein